MLNQIALALAASSMALLTPAAASACDLDGIDGMHRMNPFAGMAFGHAASMPPPTSTERTPERAQTNVNRGDHSAKEKAESRPLPVRKWEQQGDSAPVSAEDHGTFT